MKKRTKNFKKTNNPKKEFIPSNINNSKGSNDKRWFNNIHGLLDSITLPQFLVRKGIPNIGGQYHIGIPSVAAIQVALTMCSNDQLAFTNSIDKLYANLRRANTGAAVYTKQDLAKYLYNLSTAIVVDRYLRRAYGVCNKYSGLDAKLPIAYFKAMGLDYDSFKDNMSNLRSFINNNSIRLHSIISGKCDLFERRAWMFDNIFKDGQTNKSQEYIFTIPESLSFWDWANNTIGTVTIPLYTGGSVGRSYSGVITAVTIFMQAITNDNKVNYISADLIKAYGLEQSKDYFTVIPENYCITSVYNEEVLNEIQNAKFCGGVNVNLSVNSDGMLFEAPDINTQSLFSAPTNTSYTYYIDNNFINYYRNDIDILDYAVATRLSPRMYFDPGDNKTHLSTWGSEIPMYMRFVVPMDNNILANTLGNGLDSYNLTLSDYDPFRLYIQGQYDMFAFFQNLWSYFDWAPMFIALAYANYDAAGTLNYWMDNTFPSLDLDNYAILDTPAQLSNIHNACNQSLLYWPDVIKDQRVLTLPTPSK